jgi:hypothetical protein
VLVAEAPAGETRWGRYQFPTFGQMGDRLALTFHVAEDSARAYGQIGPEPNRGLSADGARTWSLVRATEPMDGMLLPNGDRIRIGTAEVTPKSVPVEGLKLPASVGTLISTYGQLPYVYCRHDELPATLQGVPLSRRPAGSMRWVEERARLDDPAMLRYTILEVFPMVWWGDVHLTADGSLLAIVYPCSLRAKSPATARPIPAAPGRPKAAFPTGPTSGPIRWHPAGCMVSRNPVPSSCAMVLSLPCCAPPTGSGSVPCIAAIRPTWAGRGRSRK